MSKCPACGYWDFNGQECSACGYRVGRSPWPWWLFVLTLVLCAAEAFAAPPDAPVIRTAGIAACAHQMRGVSLIVDFPPSRSQPAPGVVAVKSYVDGTYKARHTGLFRTRTRIAHIADDNQPHTIWVKAVNGIGEESPASNSVQIVTPPCPPAPDEPMDLWAYPMPSSDPSIPDGCQKVCSDGTPCNDVQDCKALSFSSTRYDRSHVLCHEPPVIVVQWSEPHYKGSSYYSGYGPLFTYPIFRGRAHEIPEIIAGFGRHGLTSISNTPKRNPPTFLVEGSNLRRRRYAEPLEGGRTEFYGAMACDMTGACSAVSDELAPVEVPVCP